MRQILHLYRKASDVAPKAENVVFFTSSLTWAMFFSLFCSKVYQVVLSSVLWRCDWSIASQTFSMVTATKIAGVD